MSHTEINWYRLVLLDQIPAVVLVSVEAGFTLTDTHTSGTTPQFLPSNILFLEFELQDLRTMGLADERSLYSQIQTKSRS